MSELPPLEIGTNVQGNQFYANTNKLSQFNVLVKNKGSVKLPRITITLNGPPEVKVVTKVKNIGFIPRGGIRTVLFKVKSKVNGTYDLEVVVKRKEKIIEVVKMKFSVGQAPIKGSTPQAQRQSTTPLFNIKLEECPDCGEKIEEGAKYCPHCGKEIGSPFSISLKGVNICPNCGSQQPPQANFCGECGSDIN